MQWSKPSVKQDIFTRLEDQPVLLGFFKVTFQGRLLVQLREVVSYVNWGEFAQTFLLQKYHETIYKLEHWWRWMLWACHFFSCERRCSSTLNMFVAQGRYGRYDHWNPLKTLEGSWTLGPIAGELSGCSVVFLARVILVLIVQNCTIKNRFFLYGDLRFSTCFCEGR